MARINRIIPTFFMAASLVLLLGLGGLHGDHGGHDHSHSHSHTHAHTHDNGITHTHGHTHAGHNCGAGFTDHDDEPTGEVIASAPAEHSDHHCCHEDHSHATPVYVFTQTGPRWQDQLDLAPCALPELWQPMAVVSPKAKPIPPPPRAGPGDPLSQLRTVVLLT